MTCTQEMIQSLLSYDPETGMVSWKKRIGKSNQDKMAGWLAKSGHRYIKVANLETTMTRAIWLHVYGFLPDKTIEFINWDRTDFRLTNLRMSGQIPRSEITHDELKKLVSYDPETGQFIWIFRTSKKTQIGEIAGRKNDKGYVIISINYRNYRAHVLAWLYMTGEWPTKHIDHIDGNTSNNKFSNLREAEVFQNMANSKKPITNTSGYKGVSWHAGANKWQAHIRNRGKTVFLGLFVDPEEAHRAYCRKAFELKGEFARTS